MQWYRDYFPPSVPIAVKGGIKSRSKRGTFATSWWARRWISVLEALNLGGRLQRARSYARRGQVLDIAIEPGTVRAEVQGSRPKPYAIAIGVAQIGTQQTKRLAAELAKNPYCLAKLMAREMPQDIETLFNVAGVSLFPSRASELHTECSCPDWSNPCKHIAAVYYLLGEEFDRDPFLILRLRGIDTAALLDAVGGTAAPPEIEDADSSTPLHHENFWEGERAEIDLTVDTTRQPAPLLHLLGNLPFWRGEQPLAESLEPAYAQAAGKAVELLSS
jgi:uncharacterized Zn finger protein